MFVPSLISICIPVYNAVEFIEETISCFLNQTYKNWEIIIQDDCSTDSTWELISKKHQDNPQIKLYRNPVNLGIGKNWNEAYNKATGEFVVIFNADDLVDPNFLEQGIEHFKAHPSANLIISSYIKSNEERTSELILLTKSYRGITKDLINIDRKPLYRISWNYTLGKKASLDKLKNEYGLFYPTQVCDAMLWYEAYQQKLTAFYTGEIAGVYRMHENNNSKIPLAEFESTLLWMMPIYSKIFKAKNNMTWYSGYILFIKYFYASLKHGKRPKIIALKNIFLYA